MTSLGAYPRLRPCTTIGLEFSAFTVGPSSFHQLLSFALEASLAMVVLICLMAFSACLALLELKEKA